MQRVDYLDLAASGLRMPIGTDLVLREQPDEAEILLDGVRLGKVVEQAAKRYNTPLAFPLMDLTVEKEALLLALGVDPAEIPTYHFNGVIEPGLTDAVRASLDAGQTPRMRANAEAISYIASNTDLVPCGMCIGPFSFMTKLIADPIAPVYMAGTGVTGEEDAEIRAIETALDLGLQVILQSISQQIDAGAQAVIVCEPAASVSYFSPKQLAKGADTFERFVMKHNRQLKALLASRGVELIFHDCGELLDSMVAEYATLRPVIMSLGSSRKLWEDATLVPEDVVLYGNLPTKRFYATDLTIENVEQMTLDLLAQMKASGHPFILGSECDVLSVHDVREAISEKVHAFLQCKAG